MNPQIRFGEDLMSRVSYVMMNPGRRDRDDPRGAPGDRDARRAGRRRGRDRSARHPRVDLRRQPDHAPPAARHRPDRARRGAVRARHQRGDHALGERARPAGRAPERAGLRAALHRRPRRRRYRGRAAVRDPASGRRGDADRRRRHQRRDRARQPPPPARGLLADRPGVRGRPDLLRPARGPGCHRARADRPRRASSRATR